MEILFHNIQASRHHFRWLLSSIRKISDHQIFPANYLGVTKRTVIELARVVLLTDILSYCHLFVFSRFPFISAGGRTTYTNFICRVWMIVFQISVVRRSIASYWSATILASSHCKISIFRIRQSRLQPYGGKEKTSAFGLHKAAMAKHQLRS